MFQNCKLVITRNGKNCHFSVCDFPLRSSHASLCLFTFSPLYSIRATTYLHTTASLLTWRQWAEHTMPTHLYASRYDVMQLFRNGLLSPYPSPFFHLGSVSFLFDIHSLALTLVDPLRIVLSIIFASLDGRLLDSDNLDCRPSQPDIRQREENLESTISSERIPPTLDSLHIATPLLDSIAFYHHTDIDNIDGA